MDIPQSPQDPSDRPEREPIPDVWDLVSDKLDPGTDEDPRQTLLSNLMLATGMARVLGEIEMNRKDLRGSDMVRDMVTYWQGQGLIVEAVCERSGIDESTIRAVRSQAHQLPDVLAAVVRQTVDAIEPLDPERCPARRHNDGVQCGNPAGQGTTHPGEGCCRWHGGDIPKRWL